MFNNKKNVSQIGNDKKTSSMRQTVSGDRCVLLLALINDIDIGQLISIKCQHILFSAVANKVVGKQSLNMDPFTMIQILKR